MYDQESLRDFSQILFSDLLYENKQYFNSCSSPSSDLNDINAHLKYDNCVPFSPLRQVDGNISVESPPNSDIVPQSVRTRIAKFELNQSKQTAAILKDASVDDLKIFYKDSNKNINLECSSGFYAQVAKPVVHALTQDVIPCSEGFLVKLDNVIRNLDTAGNEYNLTIFFSIKQSSGKILYTKEKRMVALWPYGNVLWILSSSALIVLLQAFYPLSSPLLAS